MNGLSYNLDNWVYGANGLIGGTIHGTATGREINIGGRDFRINPDTGSDGAGLGPRLSKGGPTTTGATSSATRIATGSGTTRSPTSTP